MYGTRYSRSIPINSKVFPRFIPQGVKIFPIGKIFTTWQHFMRCEIGTGTFNAKLFQLRRTGIYFDSLSHVLYTVIGTGTGSRI